MRFCKEKKELFMWEPIINCSCSYIK